MSLALGSRDLHARKVPPQISLCNMRRLIRDGTFRFYVICVSRKSLNSEIISVLVGGKCGP